MADAKIFAADWGVTDNSFWGVLDVFFSKLLTIEVSTRSDQEYAAKCINCNTWGIAS